VLLNRFNSPEIKHEAEELSETPKFLTKAPLSLRELPFGNAHVGSGHSRSLGDSRLGLNDGPRVAVLFDEVVRFAPRLAALV
jgi:hypothetical protein